MSDTLETGWGNEAAQAAFWQNVLSTAETVRDRIHTISPAALTIEDVKALPAEAVRDIAERLFLDSDCGADPVKLRHADRLRQYAIEQATPEQRAEWAQEYRRKAEAHEAHAAELRQYVADRKAATA